MRLDRWNLESYETRWTERPVSYSDAAVNRSRSPWWCREFVSGTRHVMVYAASRHNNRRPYGVDVAYVDSSTITPTPTLHIEQDGRVHNDEHGAGQWNRIDNFTDMERWRLEGPPVTVTVDVSVDAHGLTGVTVWPLPSVYPLRLTALRDVDNQPNTVPAEPEANDEALLTPGPINTMVADQEQYELPEDHVMIPTADVALLQDLLVQEAQDRGWCSEFEGFVTKFNSGSTTLKLKGRQHQYTGRLDVTFAFEAGRNGEAREGLAVVRQAVEELLQRFGTLNTMSVGAQVFSPHGTAL